jgi:FlaA1/EpsC-like NDP-sugar epimerase
MRGAATKYAIDTVVWLLAAPLALWLRVDDRILDYLPGLGLYLAIGALPKLGAAFLFALHRQSWRRAGVRDLYAILVAVGAVTVLLTLVSLAFQPVLGIPRSVPVIEGVLAVIGLSGVRLATRLLHERRNGRSRVALPKRVLVAGAGDGGTRIAREMLRHSETGMIPVGFLDDDPAKQRQRFLGLPVLGTLSYLARAARQVRADEVLIAMPSAPGRIIRMLVAQAREAGLPHKIMPGIAELLSGRVSFTQIREVRMEDLLRREPVRLQTDKISNYLAGRVVLVTGAGGSIGSELVRQLARFGPERVILLGRGENSLYLLERELDQYWPKLAYRSVVGDVRDRAKMEHVYRNHTPSVVFHAAAHKHVPLMELNPDEAVLNNVAGTKNLVELALEFGTERFVNVSTDKAVNPTSVMGASKRLAECVIEWAAQRTNTGQRFVSVRFGNVLGSRGSVIPLFQEQIRTGTAVTVTHPEMARYFMTIPEASQLVLQAAGLGQNGALYLLDMGDPVRILDLANDLIRLSGLEPDIDVPVVVTGARPGEKLFEELLTKGEGINPTEHEKIFVIQTTCPQEVDLDTALEALFAAAHDRDPVRIRAALAALVPTYAASGTALPS